MSSFIEQIYNAAYADALGEIKQANTLVARAFRQSPQGVAARSILRKTSQPARSMLDIRTPRFNSIIADDGKAPNMRPMELMNSPVEGSQYFTYNGKPLNARAFARGASSPAGEAQGAFDVFKKHLSADPEFYQLRHMGPETWKAENAVAADSRAKILELFKQFMVERKAMQSRFGQ